MDRTSDFFALVDAAMDKVALKESRPFQHQIPAGRREAEFGAGAETCSSRLFATTAQLAELERLAKDRGIFNDKTSQIETLAFNIKEALGDLGRRIEALDSVVAAASHQQSKHESTHEQNVVQALKQRFFIAGKTFGEILELRKQTMKKQDSRRSLYSYAHTQEPAEEPSTLDLEAGQLMVVSESGVDYQQRRAQTVENIHKMVIELAQMFQKVASLISHQEEMVQRIDQDVDASLASLRQGEVHLMRWYRRVSSNRSLMIKIFAILVIFILLFVFVVA